MRSRSGSTPRQTKYYLLGSRRKAPSQSRMESLHLRPVPKRILLMFSCPCFYFPDQAQRNSDWRDTLRQRTLVIRLPDRFLVCSLWTSSRAYRCRHRGYRLSRGKGRTPRILYQDSAWHGRAYAPWRSDISYLRFFGEDLARGQVLRERCTVCWADYLTG